MRIAELIRDFAGGRSQSPAFRTAKRLQQHSSAFARMRDGTGRDWTDMLHYGKVHNDMKRINSVVLVLVGVLCFASAKHVTAGQSRHSRSRDTIFANSLADGGRVRMKHSPVLGINVPIAVWIDGVQAGAFAKGHVYERYLTPGRHNLYASRPMRRSDSWYGTLDVRRGETLSFVVKCTPYRVILQPVSRID